MAGRKGVRADFKPELKRVMAAIQECEALERELAALLELQTVPMLSQPGKKNFAGRGSASVYIRLTEQRLSNRLQKHHLVKMIWDIKRDIVDRDLKIAVAELKAESLAEASAKDSAVTAALLAFLQGGGIPLYRPAELLEPGDYEVISVAAPEARPPAGEAPLVVPDVPPAPLPAGGWPDGLPEDVAVGDTVSDPSGALWVVGEEGCEPAGVSAAEVFLEHPSGAPPFARLADGRLVLVFAVE